MPNNTNNFVTESQPNTRNEIIQIPSARRISVDPGQIFAEPNARQTANQRHANTGTQDGEAAS